MKRINYTALMICATIIVALSIVSAAVILISMSKNDLPDGWLALFLAFIGTSLGVLVSLGKLDEIDRKTSERLDSMGSNVNDLTNGLMDSKIRAAVSEVISPDLQNHANAALVREDIARRNGNDSVTE